MLACDCTNKAPQTKLLRFTVGHEVTLPSSWVCLCPCRCPSPFQSPFCVLTLTLSLAPPVSHQPQTPQRVVSPVPLLRCVTEGSRERLAREGVHLGTRLVAGILFCNFIAERPDCKSPLPKFQLSSVQSLSCVRLSVTP